MRFKKTKIVLATMALTAIAGVAFAYWTGTGSGTGTGTVGTSGAVVLTGTIADGLAPGAAEPVSLTAANSGDTDVQVTTVHLAGIVVDAGHAACETADFTMADVTENHEVPAGATVEALPTDGSLAYANTGVNQDSCKGATLTLTLTSS